MSGNWYDPAQAGQGFQLEFAQDNRAVAIWFTFAPDGSGLTWIYGQGTYEKSQNIVSLPAVQLGGTSFPPQCNASNVYTAPWGTLTFAFSDCNTGVASWDTADGGHANGYSNGAMPIHRLSQISGTTCPMH